ncbi:hypothetical protein [uncultured Nostoc sp.]
MSKMKAIALVAFPFPCNGTETKRESKAPRVTLFNRQGDRTGSPFPLRN